MTGITYSETREIVLAEIVTLYEANGWSAAKKPRQLYNALRNSDTIVSARAGDELVGLGNAISDGHLVVYYPHLLVLPAYQGKGIGTEILTRLKSKYEGFHQHIVVADGRAVDFYLKNGFEKAGGTQSMWIYHGGEH